jgi:predicted kinase
MFAGPNGSGKSTIKSVIRPELLGIYVNPDEIEEELRLQGYLDLDAFGVSTTQSEVLVFFRCSELLKKAGLLAGAESLMRDSFG